ncbi:MAG: hypothetical protein ACRDLN_00420 [Solirubrobacteraceae bacterium]
MVDRVAARVLGGDEASEDLLRDLLIDYLRCHHRQLVVVEHGPRMCPNLKAGGSGGKGWSARRLPQSEP